jgi:hypothetical protein
MPHVLGLLLVIPPHLRLSIHHLRLHNCRWLLAGVVLM